MRSTSKPARFSQAKCSRRAISESLEPRRLLASNPTVIDLLVLYTTQAKTDQGGDAAIQSEIQGDVDFTNTAMQNSQIPITIRLVHSQEITGYTAAGSVMQDELNMQGSGNNPSFHAAVLALRNQYGADLVDLVTTSPPSSPNEGGFSQQMTSLTPNDTLGYSAIDESSLGPSNDTLAHEIGHNLGAAHARGDNSAPPGPYDYDYGYRVQGTDGSFYDDIMSISQSINDIRVPLYSNPNLTVDGVPFGVPVGQANQADLAAAFPLTAPIVAAYRSTVVADTTPPVAELDEMDPNGQTLTFTVRYLDDEAVNASGIASGNVYVTSPEGFNLSAQLLSVTGGTGNSFQKFATYRVTLPTANEPLSSLKVMLRANQIEDINGNFTAAGQINFNSQDPADDPGEGISNAQNLGVPAPTVIVSNSVNVLDFYDDYQFTLNSSEMVSIHLTGLTADSDVWLYRDTNNDGILENGELMASTVDPGASIRALDENLAAGTYYIRILSENGDSTPYTMTLSAFTDTTPPTATLDATDVKATGVSAAQFAVNYSDNEDLDGQSVRYGSEVDFQVQLDNGADFDSSTFPDSSNSDIDPQDAPSYRTTYSYFAGSGGFTTNDNGLYTVIIPANTVQDAAGNFMPQTTLGSFRIEIGTPDTTPPIVASVVAPSETVPAPTYSFSVTYHDNVALNAGTIGTTNLKITGPNNFSFETVTFVSAPQTAGSDRTVTYQIAAPGGSWNYLDNGTYTISMQAGQVKDTAGNAAAAGTIATFTVACPLPGDASGDGKTNAMDFDILATNYGKFGQGFSTGDFNFDGVVNVADFNLLAGKFNQSLPAGSLPAAGAAADLFGTTPIGATAMSLEQSLSGSPTKITDIFA